MARRWLSHRSRWLIAALIMLIALWVMATPAAAHTGFESSSPAEGAVIDEPVTEIALIFSGEATPVGEGFVILDPFGTVREPDDVSSNDSLTWTLRFEEPLAGGDVGVRWMVAAPDAHPIDGSFSFTVSAPVPAAEAIDQAGAVTAEPADEASAQEPFVPDDEAGPAASPPDPSAPTANIAGAVDVDAFLETPADEPAAASPLATLARISVILGALLVIGGASFAAFCLRGSRSDIRAVLYWVRRGGALVVLGASLEAVTLIANLAGAWSGLTSPGQVSDALWSSAGLAIGLRLVGGFLATFRTSLSTARATTVPDPVLAARQLATVGAGHAAPRATGRTDNEPFVYPHDHVWNHTVAFGALAGVALLALSFAFDGHSASEGPRWLHAIANLVHVTTAATWAGGVAMLVYVIGRRRRRHQDSQALQLAMRFSVIASIALVAAGVAGLALSAIVLDSISEIWSTPWGRLLSLKVFLVTIAAAGGGYNHRVVVPALDRAPTDQATIDRFRTIVTVEAVALISAAVVTALLVGASTT